MKVTDAQQVEIDKYAVCYEMPYYRMSDERRVPSVETLAELPWRGSYLDVGCGRGEMLQAARDLGFKCVQGTEVVPELIKAGPGVIEALAWDLPFQSRTVEVVSMFDVIEHLLPGDDEAACREIDRVADRAIIITANNHESQLHGVQLHVNRRPYLEWNRLFRKWFTGNVKWLEYRRAKKSEMWLVTR